MQTTQKSSKPKKTVLFLHVEPSIKQWLKQTASRQVGTVSNSTLAARIFTMAKNNPKKFGLTK